MFELFKHYVLWGLTYTVLSSLSGYSIPYLVKRFHRYFEELPPELPHFDQSACEVAYLLLDGWWLDRWYVLMVYRQSKNLLILHISVAGREASTKIATDLRLLTAKGYRFTGVVSDGGTGIVSAVTEVFPHIPHQRCLAHMHRRMIAGIGKRSKDERVSQLRSLADHVWLIESREALRWWQKQVSDWVNDNWTFLHERRYDSQGHWWYVHKGVRSTVRVMASLPKTSFVFLYGHPLMPKTTNEIEAQFGHLGKRWLAHRGLKTERWEKYLKWFVYLYNCDKLSSKNSKSVLKNHTKC